MHEAWNDAARPGARIGRAIEAHASIGSTNDRARELLSIGDADGIAVVADAQTAGRGRRGRTWLSPAGRNLMLSVALRPQLSAADAWQLGLAAGLGLLAATAPYGAVGLKWPNDLLDANERKLGGLLVETIASGARLAGAVIGIGVNVNWRRSEMPIEIAGTAGSLADLYGADVDRVALLRALLEALEGEIDHVERGASPLERYRRACTTIGARVRVVTPEGTVDGEAVGLDANGALVVDSLDGPRSITSGEVTRVERAVLR